MADKRAQVTIFIILGIIIIIAFLLVMMLTNRYSETDRQAVALAKSKLDASVVSYYVTGCIEQAFNKGMVLLSSQGGRIYSNQNGSMLNCDALNCTLAGSIANVSYGLTLSPNQYATPKYPCIDNSLAWPYCKFYFHPVYSQQISLFGQETLPAMESIQRQLEEYIEYDVDKCINFDTIGLDSGLPFSIQRQSPEVEVEIGSQDVKVNLFLPITIDVGGNIVSEVKQYTYADSIRLKQVHNFVSDIIKTDNRLLSYNVATDFQKSRWFSSGMQFSISYNRKQNDDLITITDQNSRINDKPLEFKFARQNLPPVLNYVHTNFSTPIYDNIYLEGQQLQITAEGFDPNEDNLIYSFSGWKVDYDEVFDSATGRITRRANVANPLQVNGNKASVFLGASDAGPHNITVSVTDGQFTDYQVVRVLVDDIVRLQVVGSNPYADIPNNFASVEDPYKFEAVTTDHFNAGDNVYTWDDSAEARLYEGSEQMFWLPGAIQLYNDISIGNIAGKFNIKAQHTINAKVVAGIVNGVVNQDAKVLSVNVRECLPHRSTSAPYPLNNVDSGLDKYIDTTADPFLGDHSCCIGDPQGNSGEWHIAPAGTICYEQAEYGALQGNNDVYKRGSVWRCDGLRGNICAGQKENVPLQLVEVCADTGGPDGVCSGPGSRQAITPEPQQCVNYFGPDFENNACDNRLKCSTQSTYNTASGTRLCRAGCNGNGGCTSPLNWNICESAEQKELLGACSQDLSVSENRVYSLQCSCVQGSGDDAIQCARIDLDTSQAKCVQCGFSWSTDCYGDDSWET